MKYTHFNNRKYEIHTMAYDKVSWNSTVLDVGCAAGYMSKELQNKNCIVYGVDYDTAALKIAKKYCVDVFKTNLNQRMDLPFRNKSFDYVLLLDVIEHLDYPVQFLGKIKKYLKKDGKLIVSTPNIAHISMRLQLLSGNFTYTTYGLMDNTHVHFYTKASLLSILQYYGYRIESIEASSDFGQIPYFSRFLRHLPKFLQWKITQVLPTILGVQWLVTCTI